MTNTWRRSPGAQPPHQQHVRRFGGNVRQRSASSALRLPQGGSRCAPRWWTRREARQLLPLPLLATGLPSAGGPGRAGAPALDAAGGGTRTRKRKATASVLHEHCRIGLIITSLLHGALTSSTTSSKVPRLIRLALVELPQRDADFLGGHEGVEIVDEGVRALRLLMKEDLGQSTDLLPR
eukprot:SM000112S23970  [mRNA]  locus=s112:28886:29465:+ [translate_table: standard]